MTDAPTDKRIEIALRLGLMSDEQLEVIGQKQAGTNYSPVEVAIRNGYLNRSQLDLINVFSNPLDVVPGYRINGLIGQGGVGIVFKATQLRMDRDVAIKTINQSSVSGETSVKRFEREAQIVGKLRHPNIISAFDFGIHNEKLFLVMEFVEGIDGEKLLEQKSQLPESQAWHIALQVCHALDYANQNGIIHRDIKPGNLILTEPPSGSELPAHVPFVKIADFGLARFKDNPTSATITMDTGISGTPFYMSPEQVRGKQIDQHSDIYALGVTLWHMIAGYPPVSGATALDVITEKIKIEDKWMSDVPDEISTPGFELLKKMCRFNREERIEGYASLIEEIKAVLGTLDEESPESTSDVATPTEKFSASTNVTFVGEFEEFELNQTLRTSPAVTASATNATQDFKPLSTDAPRSNRKIALTSTLALLAACFAGLYFWPKATSGSPQSTDGETVRPVDLERVIEAPAERLQEPGSLPVTLFDGFHVDPTGQGPGSKWASAEGLEGGRVLAGNGLKKFKCVGKDGKPLDYFRFSSGFRLNEAEQIEVSWLNSKSDVAFRIVVEPEMANLYLGESKLDSCTIPKFGKESFGYHQIQIESQPGYWRIAIGTNFIKHIRKPEGEEQGAVIQLNVSGSGSAHFEGPSILPFKS